MKSKFIVALISLLNRKVESRRNRLHLQVCVDCVWSAKTNKSVHKTAHTHNADAIRENVYHLIFIFGYLMVYPKWVNKIWKVTLKWSYECPDNKKPKLCISYVVKRKRDAKDFSNVSFIHNWILSFFVTEIKCCSCHPIFHSMEINNIILSFVFLFVAC